MKDMLLRKAIVIDNADTDNKDKIKVRILPEMKDVDEDLLPFIYPLFGTALVDTQSHNIPEIDSQVYVLLLTKSWKSNDMRYLPKCLIRSEIDYTIWNNNVKTKISELVSTYSYPQPNIFEFYIDGSAYFRNTETGECGFFHNNDSYILWDENGAFIINNKNQPIKFYNNNSNISIEDDGTLSLKNTISDLRTEVENLWTAIISINTNLQSFVSTNAIPGSPVTPNPATLALFVADNVNNNFKKSAVASLLT